MKKIILSLVILTIFSNLSFASSDIISSSETLLLSLPNQKPTDNAILPTYKTNQNYNVKPNSKKGISDNDNIIDVKNDIAKVKKESRIILNDRVLDYSFNRYVPKNTLPSEFIYKQEQRFFDAIDPIKQAGVTSYYPGLRGPNQLVIYTSSYGDRTGTNEFGTEAIVYNNMVVSLNGADSIIPQGGFVISGHGQAKKWIAQHIQLGSKVYIDRFNKTINVYLTPESLTYAAKEKLREVNEIVEYYKNIDILYNDKKAIEYLESAKVDLRKAEKKPEKAQSYINEAMKSLNEAIKNAIPYNDKELKGVWLRPIELDEKEIEKTVERIYNSGITDIFLETYFHGKTIYPSEYLHQCGVISQREEFVGFDPLQVWIDEAHKRNMKIHVWFETFYVGNDKPETVQNHVLSVYPKWNNKRLMNYNVETPVSSLSEHNGYFLDPANIQVQTYLLNIVKEIINNYKIDGINLDYIRYPQTVDSSFSNYASMNWGYTQFAREEFKNLYGVDPIDIKFGTGDWQLWSLYRQNKIADFIKETRKMTKPANIKLTAVIFPDLNKSISTKMQNWKVWSYNDYIDGFTPLILTGDKNTADLLLKDVVKNSSPYTNIYPGIFVPFMGGTYDELLTQIHKTREVNSKGSILFDYAHLQDDYLDALSVRVFNKEYEPRDMQMKQNIYHFSVKTKDKKKNKKHRKNRK